MTQPPKGGTVVRCSKNHVVTTLSARSQLGSGETRELGCPTCGERVRFKAEEVGSG